MPRIKITRTEYATVCETTEVYVDVPEGRDPEDLIIDIEDDGWADDLIEKTQEDAFEKGVFVGSPECSRSYDWGGGSMTDCEVVE